MIPAKPSSSINARRKSRRIHHWSNPPKRRKKQLMKFCLALLSPEFPGLTSSGCLHSLHQDKWKSRNTLKSRNTKCVSAKSVSASKIEREVYSGFETSWSKQKNLNLHWWSQHCIGNENQCKEWFSHLWQISGTEGRRLFNNRTLSLNFRCSTDNESERLINIKT